jgi:hypothetical protein
VQKLKSAPKGFTVGVKAEIGKKKKLFNLPQELINAKLYGLVLAKRLKKKDMVKFLGGQFATQKCSKLAPRFFGPHS